MSSLSRASVVALSALVLSAFAVGCGSSNDVPSEAVSEDGLSSGKLGEWQSVRVVGRSTKRIAFDVPGGSSVTFAWTDHYGVREGKARPRATLDVRVLDGNRRGLTATAHNTDRNDNGLAFDPLVVLAPKDGRLVFELSEVDGYSDEIELRADLPKAPTETPDAAAPSTDASLADASLEDPGPPPQGLAVYRAGATSRDAVAVPTGGALLAGGGRDDDAAMTAAIAASGRGDAVVLRMDDTKGAYAPYLVSLGAASTTEVVFDATNGNDSVDGANLVALRALADSAYIERLLARAELVFFAGGNQTKYVDVFTNTRLSRGVDALVARGGVVGGTSAGMHVLAGVVHTPRGPGNSVTSSAALRDPYLKIGEVPGTASLDFSPSPFRVPGLESFVLDTHFAQRGRLGRSAVFLARELRDGLATVSTARGLACDEGTAVFVERSGKARVFGPGTGGLTMLIPAAAPDRCQDNLTLDWRTELDLVRVQGSDTLPASFDLRTTSGDAVKTKLSVKDGVLSER